MDARWQRFGALSGIVFAVLAVVAILLGGDPPSTAAAAEEVVAYISDKADVLTVESLLFALALPFFLWFLATFAEELRAGGSGGLSRAVYGGGLYVYAVSFATAFPMLALAWRGGEINPVAARLAQDTLALGASVAAAGNIALCVAAAIAIRGSRLPDWLVPFSWLVAALSVLEVAGVVVDEGFLRPAGPMAVITMVGFALWVVAIAVPLSQLRTGTAVPDAG